MSRPRSGGRASAAPARGATQRGVYVQAPKSDIFVVLLGVALGSMIVGCLLMFLVLNRYGFSRKVSSNFSAPIQSIALANGTIPSLRVAA